MRKIVKWIKDHVRPSFGYHMDRGEEIKWTKDNIGEIIDKSKKKVDVGVKIKFKF